MVIGADAITDEQMASFANWTNLSETTFLLKPVASNADYRVRIFTPERGLPFAGRPTLGSCQVWLNAGNIPKGELQECRAGRIPIKLDGNRLAFSAPPLLRSGVVEQPVLEQIAKGLHIQPEAIKRSQWLDNGPGWVAVMLSTRSEVLDLRPDYAALSGLKLGVVAPWDATKDVRRRSSKSARSSPVWQARTL